MTATETKSKADMRVSLRWIPKDSRKIEHALGVCYVEEKTTARGLSYNVLGFIGTAQKSAMYESYRTVDARDKRVTEFFANLESHAERMTERKAEREKPHSFKVGDVIYNSWGYDQTNIDFYVIVKTTANYVWTQPIACQSVPSEGCAPMSGHIQPELPIRPILTREVREYGDWEPGIGNRTVAIKTVSIEPTKRKAEGSNYVHFEHGCGSVWDGRPKYESWYA